MVAAHGLIGRSAEARLRSEGHGIFPHVVQLVGRDPVAMGEGARLAEASGADVIDINFGCPAKKVVGGSCGSALMREPSLALAIVTAVIAAVTVPVTVKMRLGWDDRSLNAAALVRSVAGAGACAVTVHGRTRQQFYSGRADWAAVRGAVDAASLPVIVNGDVDGVESARAALSASGAAAVMIGRAALGQPWLIGEVAGALDGIPYRAPSVSQRAEAALEHYEALLGLYGREVGLRHARKHLAGYADRAAEAGFGLPAVERGELVTGTDTTRVAAILARIYDEPMRRAA
jgi:tRNA-dihydrouridine synthase B